MGKCPWCAHYAVLIRASEAKKALTACEPPTKAGAWHNAPSWEQIAHGAQPPSSDDAPKLGAWRHGWQRCASRPPFLLRPRAVAFSASSPVAHGHPDDEVTPQLPWPPLEPCNSRLPLPLALQRVCGDPSHHRCGHFTDDLGDHALACPRIGLLAAC